MENTDQAIKERLESIYPNPEVAAKIVNLVVHNRPLGWGRKSNAPYYKEIYAKQLKTEIDKMIANNKPLCFRYATWCNTNTGMSRQTLYNRVNQSIRYLVEQMDADRTYYNWLQSVRIERLHGVGIVISYIAGLSASEQFKADEIEPRENMPPWKRDMEDWLESDNITPFCKEGLALSPEEVFNLTKTLGALSNIQAFVDSASVKIIKVC